MDVSMHAAVLQGKKNSENLEILKLGRGKFFK